MKTWFTSRNGAIVLLLIALIVFLGRTFIDFQFVYADFASDLGMAALMTLINMALFGGWMWALLAAARGSRRGLIAALVLDLLLVFGLSVGTALLYCPSPCDTAWPLAEIFNWASLIFGLLAAVAVGFQLRQSAGGAQAAAADSRGI